jgi:hypothetical protein
MAGMPMTLNPGWKAEKEMAARYAFRQQILSSLEAFLSRRIEEQELDKALDNICLVALPRHISGCCAPDTIMVPIIDSCAVMMNGDTDDASSFADVIAPYMLLKARPSTHQVLSVDILDELKNSGLMKQNGGDTTATRLLRGLVAMWQVKLVTKRTVPMNENTVSTTPAHDHRHLQLSKAFPEKLSNFVPPKNPAQYARMEGSKKSNGRTKVPLPSLGGDIPMSLKGHTDENIAQAHEHHNPQLSKAFPENLLNLVPPYNSVQYAKIDGTEISIGTTKVPLPSLDGDIPIYQCRQDCAAFV